MLATSEGSFSSGTQAGEFSAFVCLPKMHAVSNSRKPIERIGAGSPKSGCSSVIPALVFLSWLENSSKSKVASFTNGLWSQISGLDDSRCGTNRISDSAKECCRCAFDGANTVGVQLVPNVPDPFRA